MILNYQRSVELGDTQITWVELPAAAAALLYKWGDVITVGMLTGCEVQVWVKHAFWLLGAKRASVKPNFLRPRRPTFARCAAK
jgi:hypothetical protein